MPRKRLVAAGDSETDPFLFGRIPQPFAWGLLFTDGQRFMTWGKDCTKKFVNYLLDIDYPTEIYMHNGGKFDFHFLLPYANKYEDVKIINGRIATMHIGQVKLIDSFLLMPFALEKFRKTKIDYEIFEKEEREKPENKAKIKSYLMDDCRDLLELVTGFHKIVGKKLTIGGAAFANMKKLGHDIPNLGAHHDEKFRKFYYGGRVQTFKKGIFNKRLKYLDINSAYPYAMTFEHPTGDNYIISDKLPPLKKLGPQFVTLTAISKGALPVREKDGLHFPSDDMPTFFNVTGWEIKAGLETDTLKILQVHSVYTPAMTQNFKKFITFGFDGRLKAKKEKNKIMDLAYKYLINSGYGKFATDPEKFKEYMFAEFGESIEDYDWETDFNNEVSLWSKPSTIDDRSYYDVATAASITGFVRAFLWRSICNCKNVYYCDTDSIICSTHNLPLSEKLGDWKVEGILSKVYIAGKKLYAGYVAKTKEWKIACKGARLKPIDIKNVALGKTVRWQNIAPTFSVKKEANFIERDIKIA